MVVDAARPRRAVAGAPGLRQVARVQVHGRGLAPPGGAHHHDAGVGVEVGNRADCIITGFDRIWLMRFEMWRAISLWYIWQALMTKVCVSMS